MPPGEAQWVVVGRVGRPHGLRGEVTVQVRTDSPEQRFRPGAQFGVGAGRTLTV
ncbi:MAG: ribosome maturation factor RimM, partial [Pseudonocardiaceae bacterium]